MLHRHSCNVYFLGPVESRELELQMEFVKKVVAYSNLVLGTGQDSLQKFWTGLTGPLTRLHKEDKFGSNQFSVYSKKQVSILVSCAKGHG